MDRKKSAEKNFFRDILEVEKEIRKKIVSREIITKSIPQFGQQTA